MEKFLLLMYKKFLLLKYKIPLQTPFPQSLSTIAYATLGTKFYKRAM